MLTTSNQLLWSMIGLLLTMGGTFLEAHITTLPWSWGEQGLHSLSLGVTFQIGGVLLVGCLGGKNAGALSQIAYIVMGLTLLPVFADGGGIGYIKLSQFGYLLGFIPGAWICGLIAFKAKPKLETLAFSCVCGLLSVHLCGISYLVISYILQLKGTETMSLMQAIERYSWFAIPGQLSVVCVVTLIAYILRHLMFY
ncbi:biotin transporter BioY [Calothrix sp. 336/3]|uniref:biotin transporter BioY n=1 Tax=Calothrix sp. 336/3 TaxID=1337936 RepID=UPI0004E45245|nr:biotin transporter BioY [Calothrix sp. 336/3]AKG22094.1 biotin biosynthesis protein BioY [Calothrix sp. 336/3]